MEVIIAEGASAFIAGLGVPMPIMERLKAAGLKVMVVCGAVKHAVKAEQAGCDAVICQGGEGGGHTGLVGTLPPGRPGGPGGRRSRWSPPGGLL